jgi:hypothetical protein
VKLKGLEFYPPDVFCTYSELHMMSGFINELCALFTWSFSFIWPCLRFKSTRSATVLKLRSLSAGRVQIPWCHYRIISICHLHARLAAKVPSTHDWFAIWCYLVFLWNNTCDTLTIHWWLMSWTLPIDVHDIVVCSMYRFCSHQLFSSIILLLAIESMQFCCDPNYTFLSIHINR